jgi:hypothetical protein
MPTEHFTVVALPHSLAAADPFHVSLFVAPQLVPDSAEGRLDQFELFLHWAAGLLAEAEFGLRDHRGTIPITPVLTPIDAALWDAVFGPDTPVKGQQNPDWGGRHWRTFRAAELHDFAKLAHVVAMVLDPTSPLAPSAHPLTPFLEQLGSARRDEHGYRGYDERIITEQLDAAVGETSRRRLPLDALEKQIDGNPNALTRVLLQLHRARRFYERPESAVDYRERPVPGAAIAPLAKPVPHFAERCAMIGDHPVLQRALGLVVDVRVDDPSRLATSRWLSGRIVVGGDTGALRTTRTRCAAVHDALVTVASSADWQHGRLRIADADRFAVLDMDPDGTALKLDRYLMSLPRLAAAERNGDPVHAAPTALRTIGFTVVRHRNALTLQGDLARQSGLRTQIDGSAQPLLSTEDVTQGMRVEVYDDHTDRWYTLHARTIDVEADGHGEVLSDGFEEGFVQGTTATEDPDVDESPVHVHEAMFGWDGWSLSAPRPGRRIRHDGGDEIVEDPADDTDTVTPLRIRPRVADGTLPRLRYGRSYAFRVWATDLAGNSPPHTVGPATPVSPPAGGSRPVPSRPAGDIVAAVEATIATRSPNASRAAFADATLRSEAAAALVRRRMDHGEAEISAARVQPADLIGALPDTVREVGLAEHLVGRLVELRSGRGEAPHVRAADRAAVVSRAFADLVADETQPLVAATARIDTRAVAASIAHAGLGRAPGLGRRPGTGDQGDVAAEVDAVSPLVPFLRWDPIQPPAIVASHAYTAGESLRQVVIRSGVTQDPDTLEITVTSPGHYAAGHAALGYRATAERHLAPPKTSQSEAELHGAFDDAIGSTDPDDHRRLLAVALRENGSLFDVDVPRLDDPTVRDPQPGIALLAGADTPIAELATLPLPPGDAPFPGQYVVHNTPRLILPYLPDVLARGVSLVFPDAGLDRSIAFPFGTEGFTARYDGAWPELVPFRLDLVGSDHLDSQLDGHVLTIGLPAGDVQRFRLSSSMHVDDLLRFGLWRSLPAVIRSNADVAEAAADGWLWALTPFDDVTLVHAVPRPVSAPRHTLFAPIRQPGSTNVGIVGGVEVHGPSTESITAECRWTDPVDDLELDRYEDRARTGVAFTTTITPGEDLAVLAGGVPGDVSIELPAYGPVRIHRAVHEIDDTLHHVVHYRLRATTRFREYFDPVALTPGTDPSDVQDPAVAEDDGRSVVGPEITVNVLSSARPPAPAVHSVVPLFRWDEGDEPEQPAAVRRRRRAGVRIYLERPWFSTGEGEQLGVLLAPGGNDAGLTGLVSQWGSDPVWISAPVGLRAAVSLDNLMRITGLDDRPGDAAPVGRPAVHPLGAVAGIPSVTVLGYVPQYNTERQLWYVDVAINPGDTFWPFVRLAVARYQPDSVPGHHLSVPVLCDYVQLTPERTTSVSRTDVHHVRIVVSGPVGIRQGQRHGTVALARTTASIHDLVAANRKVVARLQRRDPLLPTDLGWETVAVTDLVVRGRGASAAEVAWVGTLESVDEIPLRRPGEIADWRVTVEEWERLPGDPVDLAPAAFGRPPVWEQRLVYADELSL